MPKTAPKTARQKRALQLQRYAAYNARQATRSMPQEVKLIRKGKTVGRRCVVYLNRCQSLSFEVVIKKYNDGTWDAGIEHLTLVEGYEWDDVVRPASTYDIGLESPKRVFDVAADIFRNLHESGVALKAETVVDIANAILGPHGETIVPPTHPCLAVCN